jgi:hypothetical protein
MKLESSIALKHAYGKPWVGLTNASFVSSDGTVHSGSNLTILWLARYYRADSFLP